MSFRKFLKENEACSKMAEPIPTQTNKEFFMKGFQKYLKEVLEQGPNEYPEDLKGLTLRFEDKSYEEGDDEEQVDSMTTYYFAIFLNGKKVGQIKTDDYFGHINGNLFGRGFPELSHYTKYVDYDKVSKNTEEKLIYRIEKALKYFFSTQTGQKWLDVSRRKGF